MTWLAYFDSLVRWLCKATRIKSKVAVGSPAVLMLGYALRANPTYKLSTSPLLHQRMRHSEMIENARHHKIHQVLHFPSWCFPAQTKRRTEGIRVPVPLAWGGSSTARVLLRLCPESACQT